MMIFKKIFIIPLLFTFSIAIPLPKTLELSTIYGDWIETDPLIIELIHSKAMQRLKKIRQYGSTDYTISHSKPYDRYTHSLGVYYLLKIKDASRLERIAGLLHDVSHTVFSHSLEPLFKGGYLNGAYQDDTHLEFLQKYGVTEILLRHNINPKSICLSHSKLPALKQPYPDACADRIEYNLYAGYLDHGWNGADIHKILSQLHYKDGKWYFDDINTATMLAEVSLYQTAKVWGSPETIVSGTLTSFALKEALKHKLCTMDEIRFSCGDDEMWGRLTGSTIPLIRLVSKYIVITKESYKVVDYGQGDFLLKSKFRGMNPWVKTKNGLKRLTTINSKFKQSYETIKNIMKKGWSIKLNKDFYNKFKQTDSDNKTNNPLINFFKERYYN